MQFVNKTLFAASVAPCFDETGADCICVAVKATYVLADPPRLAALQVPVCEAATYLAEPGLSSLVAVPELVLPTGGTDVVLQGDAWAPRNRPVTCLDTSLAVRERQKIVRVWGDRTWRVYRLGLTTKPQPFVRMPLIYERAYGGTATGRQGEVASCLANPIGQGFLGPRGAGEMAGAKRANLNDAADGEAVAGYGFIDSHWHPRRAYAGTYDAAWQQTIAPFLPSDFDRRFNRVGPPDMYFDMPLRGGEIISLVHLAPQPHLRFALPRHALHARGIGGGENDIALHLETVLLQPSAGQFCLLWRGLLPCPGGLQRVERVEAFEAAVGGHRDG
jgi:hypothetical protein